MKFSSLSTIYTHLLARYDPERKLYLAVTDAVYESVFEEAGEILLQDGVIRLITSNPEQEAIIQWIP